MIKAVDALRDEAIRNTDKLICNIQKYCMCIHKAILNIRSNKNLNTHLHTFTLLMNVEMTGDMSMIEKGLQ